MSNMLDTILGNHTGQNTLAGKSAPEKPQAQITKKPVVDAEKPKQVTTYLTPATIDALAMMQLQIKRELPGRPASALSRSKLIETAVRVMLDDFDTNRMSAAVAIVLEKGEQ